MRDGILYKAAPPRAAGQERACQADDKMPSPERSAPTSTATATQTTSVKEEEADYSDGGGDDPDEDDRTPEEKAEDDQLLEDTKKHLEVFLNAPPEVRKQLRTKAWRKCVASLEAVRLILDRPLPSVDEKRFKEDLDAGFSWLEACKMRKGRRRAALHQRRLAETQNLRFEDLPRSWFEPKARSRRLRKGSSSHNWPARRLIFLEKLIHPTGLGSSSQPCSGPTGRLDIMEQSSHSACMGRSSQPLKAEALTSGTTNAPSTDGNKPAGHTAQRTWRIVPNNSAAGRSGAFNVSANNTAKVARRKTSQEGSPSTPSPQQIPR